LHTPFLINILRRVWISEMLEKFFGCFINSLKVSSPEKITEYEQAVMNDFSSNWEEIEQSFSAKLLGIHSMIYRPISRHEKSLIDLLDKRSHNMDSTDFHVPRLPTVIPKVLQVLRHKETDISSLSKMLSVDMVLVGEVIRLANSAYHNRSRVYESLDQAIINIGFDGIKQLVVTAALKPIICSQAGHFSNITNRYLWDKSINTSLLNDCVARSLNANRFNAYLAGLVVQSGMIVVSRELDQCYNGKESLNNRRFIDEISRYVYIFSAEISRQWQFPEAVSKALEEQLSCANPVNMSKLGRITFLSDKLVKVNLLKENGCSISFDDDLSNVITSDMYDVYNRCQKRIKENWVFVGSN